MTVLVLSIVLVGIAIAGIAIKMFLQKDGQFSKTCSTIDTTNLPALALTDINTVATEVAQLALTAQELCRYIADWN